MWCPICRTGEGWVRSQQASTPHSRRTGIRRVALTGGVFQNARLSHSVAHRLTAANLSVLHHRLVPCNDGGLALGQALFGLRMLNQGRA